MLSLAGNLDPVLTGLLAEPAAATLGGGGGLRVAGAGSVLGVGEGADDGDLLAIDLDFRRGGEPVRRQTAVEPAAKRVLGRARALACRLL